MGLEKPMLFFLFWCVIQNGVVTEVSTTIHEKMKEAESYSKNSATLGQASAVYEELIANFPEQAVSAYVELGRLSARRGDFGKAESLYQEALKKDRLHMGAHLALGKLRLHLGSYSEARVMFEEAIKLDPQSADAYHALGKSLNVLELKDEALVALQRSLSLDPTNALYHYDLALTFGNLGRNEECDEHFEKAKGLSSNLDFILLGQVHQSWGRWDKAAAELKTGLAQKPNHADGWFSYGQVNELLSSEDTAIQAYEQSIKLSPGNSEAYFRLARVLSGTGMNNYAAIEACGLHTHRVIQLYKQTLELDPTHEEARNALDYCIHEVNEVSNWNERIRQAKEVDSIFQDDGKPEKAGKLQSLVKTISNKKKSSKKSAWPGEVGGFIQIPEVEINSAEELMDNYVNRNTPVKIKNFQEKFAPAADWDLQNLRKKFGENIVHVSISETGRFDGPEAGELWGVPGEEVLVRPPGTSMKFSQFLDLMALQNVTEIFYLEYLALHQYLGHEAFQMVPQPDQAMNSGMEHLLTNFWMGFTPTTSPLHYDDYENLLCQIRGKKELILFPPLDMGYLYYIGRSKGQLEYEFPGNFKREKVAESRNIVFGSSVYLDNPDLEKHPELLKATPYKVEIHPGDVLYLPAYWHHEVKSTPDKDSVNIAINFWYRNQTYFEEEASFLKINSVATKVVQEKKIEL